MRSSDADDVADGRQAAADDEWGRAYELLRRADQSESLDAADLELFATSAYLVGNVTDALDGLQRSHRAHVERGDVPRAARCLFWLGFILLSQGDVAPAGGWFARAGRLLDGVGECAEHGLLRLPQVFEAMALGDVARAEATARQIAEIGGKRADADVLSLGLHWQGRAMVEHGRLIDGMALLDESMTAVVSGEVAPYVAGALYCSMIDICREIVDLRRAHEWTAALTTWCEGRPEIITFSGQCLVHRAEIIQLEGRWQEAADEAGRACDRLARAADQYASGMAWYRRGEIYRVKGLRAEAEAAYRKAGDWGHDPQPGLALLRLAEGKVAAARTTIDRALAETSGRPSRAALLPAAVEIGLAAGDVPAAGEAADELRGIAESIGTTALRAMAGHAQGAVMLADGGNVEALATLRAAWQNWRQLDAPYEAARVRALIGLACRETGDEDAAVLELESARRVFAELGAAADLERLEHLGRRRAAAHNLTPRELEVLRLIAAGYSNRAIAAELVVAAKTVDRHVSNIFGKLGVNSRAAATGYAYEHGIALHGESSGRA